MTGTGAREPGRSPARGRRGWRWTVLGPLAAACAAGLPLLLHASLPAGDDVGHHTAHAHGFGKALFEGVVYPRWMYLVNEGMGAPSFNFYSPLSYYPVAIGERATGRLIDGFRFTLALSLVLSALTFYWVARQRTSELGAALGAALYVLAPYYLLDVYQRFAFAEAMSFPLYPLVFHFARRVLDGKGWVGLSLSYAALVLTHVVTAYILVVALVPWCLVQLPRRGWAPPLLRLAGGGLLALALCAVFLMPLVAERELVHLECLAGEVSGPTEGPLGKGCRQYLWHEHFLFAGNVPQRPRASVYSWLDSIALAHLALTLGAAAAIALARFSGRGGRASSGREREVAAWLLVGGATLFLQTPWSEPLWRLGLGAGPVQFPWRFAGLQTLAACQLAALAIPELRGLGREERRRALTRLVLVLAVAVPSLAITLDIVWRTRLSRAAGARYLTERIVDTRERNSLLTYTYIPAEVETLGVARWTELPRAELRYPGRVEVELWATHRRRVRVESGTPNQLLLKTFVYPGWTAWIDGSPAEIYPAGGERRIAVDLPSGTYAVDLEFTWTRAKRSGVAITLTTASGLMLLLLFRLRRRPAVRV